MAEERVLRRLAAILAADVVGYSRLVEADEAGTVARLKSLQSDLIQPMIAKDGGRVVKFMGDGVLVEFGSAVDAVRNALAIQREMHRRNADLAENNRIAFRVGINLGDVIIDGDDIQGDGVNIAARLEGLCEPGAVYVSATVRDHVEGKLRARFDDLGERTVKNMARPVRVYLARDETIIEPMHGGVDGALPLPDKPSIAVLPFTNMSGDPDQEYLADGITEDIITALSRFRWFFVIARNSTFVYKDQAVDIKQIGRDLGVRYVLEGSVRKAGNRLRVSAQLIEAETGNHVWAERYDRQMEDMFELQDEITRTIAAAVEPELFGFERERASHRPTEDLGAWGLFQRGVALMWRFNRESFETGRALLCRAVEMDPNFGQAYGYLAWASFNELIFGWTDDREEAIRQGMEWANRAIAIDQRDYFAHLALGRLHSIRRDHAAAIRAQETAVRINPSFAHGYYGLAAAHIFGGNPEKAIENANMAIRLSPNDPLMWVFLAHKGLAYFALNDLDQTIDLLERCCQFPTAQFIPFVWLTAALVEAGRAEDARRTLESARQREPSLSISYVQGIYQDSHGRRSERLFDALRKAGLPE